MTEKGWGRADQLVIPLGAGIATLYGEEHIYSPILQEVAHSMWNQCLKFYEEGRAKPQHDFTELDKFIEFMKKTGVPEEIRRNPEQLVKVLGAGIATLFERVDIDSPLLRKVAHSIRAGCQEVIKGEIHVNDLLKAMQPLPFKGMTPDQAVEELRKHHPPDDPEAKRWQVVDRYRETIFWDLEAPKNNEGKYICGCSLVRGGILTTSTQIRKICVVCDLAVMKWLVERLVKHPVEAELVDSPAVREGAESCYWRFHLTPSAGRL
jgi:hypothetical protein